MAEDRGRLFESVKHEFLTVPDSEALAELAERAPFILEEEFLAAAEGWMQEAAAEGGIDVAAGISERIEVLRELAGQDAPRWRAALEAFAGAASAEQLAEAVRATPLLREPEFHALVEDLVAQARQVGDDHDADALALRLDDLRSLLASDGGAGVTLAALLDDMRSEGLAGPSLDPAQGEQAAREALALLTWAPDQQALLRLAAQAPFVLDEEFIARAEQARADAAAQGDSEAADRLRSRIEGLRLIKAQVQITLPQTLEAFASVNDAGELLALAQRAPFVLDERFIGAVERAIEELEDGGGRIEAEGLRVRLEALRQIKEQQELASQSPVIQALLDFLNADEDDAARAVFDREREHLDSEEAQQGLEQGFTGGDPESQLRIELRAALLRDLRGA